ncbi:MAG: hypothetical protein ACKVW3_09875 [Phycisphaerales bacterium]
MRLAFTSLVVLTAITSSGAQQPPVQANLNPTDSLVRVIETEPSDRGVFKAGQAVVRRVEIENLSADSVSVKVTRVSCPCTVAKLDRDTLLPGSSATLTLRTHAASVAVPQAYIAEVEARAVATAQSPAGLVQTVRVSIEYSPDIEAVAWPPLLRISSLVGEGVDTSFFIRRPDGERPKLASIASPHPWCIVGDIEPVADAVSEIEVAVRAQGRPVGKHRGKVEFRVQGDSGPPQTIDVIWTVRPLLAPSRAGIVAVRRGDAWKLEHSEILIRHDAATRGDVVPVRAVIKDANAPVEVEALAAVEMGGWALRIKPRTRIECAPQGETTVSLMASNGETLGEVPVVWLSLPTRVVPTR